MTGFFDECEKLTEIEVISDNYILENDVVYNKEKTRIISFSIISPIESFTVPESVKALNDLAFYGTKNLKNLTCKHIVEIVYATFLKSSLEYIILTDDSNTFILQGFTFSYSSNLKYVEVNCEIFQMCDFMYCTSLEFVKTNANRIGPGVFMFCKSLKEFSFKGVKEIQTKAFSNCHSLNRIEFDPNIQGIAGFAFKNCINIQEVIFDQLTQMSGIEQGVFMNCIRLSSVALPIYMQNIMDFAFANTSLKEIRIPPTAQVMSHALDNNPNIKIINTLVYENEFVTYSRGEKTFITTLSKPNSTYTVPDGIDQLNALAINSNHVFNETIGAYENDLGILTLIIPESVHQISIGGNTQFFQLGLHFVENICYNGTELEMQIYYSDALRYFSSFLYYPMDPEMMGGYLVDIDGPFPNPKLYAPNLKVSEYYMSAFQILREPCPESVTPPEKIIDEADIIHKKIVIKKDQTRNSETASSNFNSYTQSSTTESSNDPILSIEGGNASNNDSKLSSREKITIAVCVSLLIVVIVLSVIYIFIREKTSTISDDSDVFEMAEETKQTGTAVTYDNPFFSAHGSLQDDPFASDFQNDDEQDQYFRDGDDE
ncbi:surface antigen BspA-like [Trichomonas vaginalis G3]|uniref:Surface antigen BspA-like n=1 Tax=Trichomonas vaginalis (strain ATCC PRA-98 / G3) TaxID=412133 RepID=A2EDK1_TRIV3|nr:ribonuclease inhibitor domain-containing protein [Trichomonas vaginalis G3]EAY09266.1 surface antigen BspA-like [Trichomonas vaginalis G3]KAI5484052.1 ribonuclease inhibitor domain-containing protein [Trichomonas vaginalis G3]|eukprot:XP_001321489.1 surface antigen BspA-like [Trichomonas vaginalis G3]